MTDCLSNYFVGELLETFPNTKVILTTRRKEKWGASLRDLLRTVCQIKRKEKSVSFSYGGKTILNTKSGREIKQKASCRCNRECCIGVTESGAVRQ